MRIPNAIKIDRIDRSRQLGEAEIPQLLFRFSLPAVVGMVVSASYNVIDRVFIGQGVGTLGIAGVTIGFPIMLVMLAFAMLIGLGGGALVSIKLGEGKRDEAEIVLGNCASLLILNAILISIFGLLFLDPLLKLFGASADVLPYARPYMSVILSGAMFQGISFGANALMRAEGNPWMAMYTMFIGAGMNLILAPLFIFVFGWGMMGAGFATITAQASASAFVAFYYLSGRSSLSFKISNMKIIRQIALRVMAIGAGPFAMQIAASVIMIVLNRSLRLYGGDIAISAMGIVHAIAMMIFMPIFGINQGAQPIIGFNYGARKYDRVIKTLWLAIRVATVIVLVGFAITRIFPVQLLRLFNAEDEELVKLGARALTIFLTFLPIVGFQILGATYFLAVGKPKISMFLTLSRQVIFLLPALLILPRFFGLNGVFMAGPFSDLSATIVTGCCVFRELRHLRKNFQ